MKATVISGMILVILGCAALVYQGFVYTSHKTVLKLGSLEVTRRGKHSIAWPPIVGGVAIVGGLALVYVGSRSGK